MAHGEVLQRHRIRASHARARGFVYVWLLFAVAFIGASLAAAGVVWEVRVRREKEADLLFIGEEIRRAIVDYHRLTPQAAKELPQRLEDLLEDKRGPATRRHLRRLYRDPISGSAEWGVVATQGRVMGVYSLARGTPIRQDGFREEYSSFKGARRYADWRFVADVPAPAPAPQPAQGGAPPRASLPAIGVPASPGAGGIQDSGPAPGMPGALPNTPALPDPTPAARPATGG